MIAEIIKLKRGPTQQRWTNASKDKAFSTLLDLALSATQADHFLRVLECQQVSTNVFLRRIHNFALDMGWLPWPVLPKRQWPKVEYGPKRAITWEEHRRIVRKPTLASSLPPPQGPPLQAAAAIEHFGNGWPKPLAHMKLICILLAANSDRTDKRRK